MIDPALPLSDLGAVDRLGADLDAHGYDADRVPALLGPDAWRALGQGHRWPALHVTGRAASDGSALATLTRLFLLGTSEPESAVAKVLPTIGVNGGIGGGVLEAAPDDPAGSHRVRATVAIRPHADDARGYLVVSDFDPGSRPGPTRTDRVPGVGAASVTLARAVIRRPVGRVLDLGTGCGIQALHCHAHAESVTATDTHARALALAAVTARLNGQRWDLRRGPLFDPVAGERFDLIVSNPAAVVSSGALRSDGTGSGPDGDELCRQLVAGLPDHLTPGGTAQLLATWTIRSAGDWRMAVGAWVAPTGLDGWVVQRDVADPALYVSRWLQDTGGTLGGDAEKRAGEWLAYCAREEVTGIGTGSITLRRPATRRAGTPDVVFDALTDPADVLSGPEADAFLARRAYLAERSDADLRAERWALAPEGLLERRAVSGPAGWTTVLRMLRRPGGPGATVQLDEWGEALLAGCTGTVPLDTVLDLLAAAHGLDPAALAAAVMPSIRTAVTRGLLRPAGGIG